MGKLRVQTNFDDDGAVAASVSDIEERDVYESGEEVEGKRRQKLKKPKYTLEEDREVVRIFDRRLVPFLALLYLLAFLDRSSMSMTLSS